MFRSFSEAQGSLVSVFLLSIGFQTTLLSPNFLEGSTDLPSNHIDVAPTFLTFADLEKSSWPPFLDGRDLSPYWTSTSPLDIMPQPEMMNIKFWGDGGIEATMPGYVQRSTTGNSYKTIRLVGSGYGYMYSHWCTGETELYDSIVSLLCLFILNVTEPVAGGSIRAFTLAFEYDTRSPYERSSSSYQVLFRGFFSGSMAYLASGW